MDELDRMLLKTAVEILHSPAQPEDKDRSAAVAMMADATQSGVRALYEKGRFFLCAGRGKPEQGGDL